MHLNVGDTLEKVNQISLDEEKLICLTFTSDKYDNEQIVSLYSCYILLDNIEECINKCLMKQITGFKYNELLKILEIHFGKNKLVVKVVN